MNDRIATQDDGGDQLAKDVESEEAVALPNKEVMSLLDVNANVDLGIDLAAPVDLAAAANLNVAAPIEAAASANVLSPLATAIGDAHQQGTIQQDVSGSAVANAPQHAQVAQPAPAGTPAGPGSGAITPPSGGGIDSMLNGGSLLNANLNLNANADLTAPVDGAIAANANVAAPVDAAVGANVGSAGATAEALAPQEVNVDQNLTGVQADATASQTAAVSQK